jgi:hypothetical protein
VDLLAGQADVANRELVPVWNKLVVGSCANFAPLLGGVVLIREPPLGLALDSSALVCACHLWSEVESAHLERVLEAKNERQAMRLERSLGWSR